MSLIAWRSRTALLLLGAAALAWAITVERMAGMDAGPGTDLGGVGWYLGVWATMSAAMMLPSAAPLVARFSPRVPAVLFVVGYLAAWTAYGLAGYGFFRLVTRFDTAWLAWDENGPYAAGGVVVAAGLYELTPLKRRLLRRCRASGEPGFRTGLANGLSCVGCCAGLMAVLFALGVMSVFWMAVVAGVIFAEKVLPHGVRLARVVAPALVALGLWVAVSPATVPMLTQPQPDAPSMEMHA